MQREEKIPPEIAVEMRSTFYDALTEREIEVLREVAAGNANKIVADHLAISEEIVKAHMRENSLEARSERSHARGNNMLKRGIIDI